MGIKKALVRVDGILQVDFNSTTGVFSVGYDAGMIVPATIAATIRDHGRRINRQYDVQPPD
ncbi:MAG: hypothetical protein V1816_23920 [Pseudomonadota bacterium]